MSSADMKDKLRLLKMRRQSRTNGSEAENKTEMIHDTDNSQEGSLSSRQEQRNRTEMPPRRVSAGAASITKSMPVGAQQGNVVQERRFQKVLSWRCKSCDEECIPIREQSRCLCGHRYLNHDKTQKHAKCKEARCQCKSFYYIVAEGAWILKCQCKHKHTDHNPVTKKCEKPNCACKVFFSPWVCNCNHPWSDHVQTEEMRPVKTLEELCADEFGQNGVVGGNAIKRTDLLEEPLRL